MAASLSDWQLSRRFRIGTATGALVFTCFGGAWVFGALTQHAGSPGWLYGVASLIVVALAVVAITRLVGTMRTPMTLSNAAHNARGAKIGKLFGIVVVIEVALIAASSILLSHFGRPLLIPVAVVLIIGLHLLPLAAAFSVPEYSVAGVLLSVAALCSLRITDESQRVYVVGLIAGAVLWATAARVLGRYTGSRK